MNQPSAVKDFLLRFRSVLGLVAIVIVSALLSPAPRHGGGNVFLAPDNLLNIVQFASENGLLAIGMTLVILTGGIDLSVGAVLALCCVGAAACLTRYHFNIFETIAAMLALGALAGTVNGLVVTRFKIQSFIMTLAMMSAARGAASLWSGGYAIPMAFGTGPGDVSVVFKNMFAGQFSLFGLAIPAQIIYFVGAGVLVSFILARTSFGRHVYAVGGNAAAARLSGVNVSRIQVMVFAASGMLAGLASLLHASLVEQGSPIDGMGYELNAIAAAVIGGTSLMGGTGTVAGSMIGALILSVLDNILGLRNIKSE
jgi:ribose transport system permease protein